MPNDKLRLDYNDPEAIPGVICKVATVSPLEVTDADLKKINKHTLSYVSADDVFIFKATIADNEQDDRNYMPFNLKALQDLRKLYVGKTMLMDHHRSANSQIGRVFDTDLVQDASKTTELGELHTELVAKIYMIKTDSNKDLIAEIIGGIKKEVSTSTVPEKMVCNICGVDNMKEYCRHWPGREYDVSDANGKSSKRRCKMLLSGAKEAYELSFVAVPAQPRASTHKSIGFTKPVEETPEEIPDKSTVSTETENQSEKTDARLVSQRLKNAESFFNANKESEEK